MQNAVGMSWCWVGVLVVAIASGCVGGDDDSAATDDAGVDAAADAQQHDAEPNGPPFPCLDPTPQAHGLELCHQSDGQASYRRRVTPPLCPSIVPRANPVPSVFPADDACDHDADCADLPLGHCTRREGGNSNECVAGCEQDSDCPTGRVCHCEVPAGRCVPATCATGADCASGFNCVAYETDPLCFSTGFVCQSATDVCVNGSDCMDFSINPTFCIRANDVFTCSTTQCTRP